METNQQHQTTAAVTLTGADLLSQVSQALGVTKTQLAAMLLVTERSLYDWAARPVSELPPKGRRLLRLAQVIKAIGAIMKELDIPKERIAAILNDGRIPIESDGDDVDSMSLVSYITAYPDDQGWPGNVRIAVQDYRAYMDRQVGKRNRA